MFPLFPFVAGLVAGSLAVRLWRREDTQAGVERAQAHRPRLQAIRGYLMKTGRRHRRKGLRVGRLLDEAQDGFVKGFVATGLLTALRDGQDRQQVLRQALLGGTALATGSAAATAADRGSKAAALIALAAGSAALYLLTQGHRTRASDLLRTRSQK